MHVCLTNAIVLCMKIRSLMEGFSECTVKVHAHALNLNNQYPTLLYVYKAAAWTSALHTMLVTCTTSFSVVHSMYRLLR